MSWNHRINNEYEEDRPTIQIYALRKEGKIEEAYQLASNLYNQNSENNDINKALSWVLIDLCKKYITTQNLSQAQIYFNELINIQFDSEDEYTETIRKQILYLSPKVVPIYSEIQKAEELSKNGHDKAALEIFKNIIKNHILYNLHYESYGWIIYRYIKAEENNLSSVEIRTFLRDYINLKNERPSLLHSMILNFALNYSKKNYDFKFYNFFILWDPSHLRIEDLQNGYKDGNAIPSLISRICRELINVNIEIDLDEFTSKIKLRKEVVIDFFREPLFWNIFRAHKENDFSTLWLMIDNYNIKYSKYGKSKWHSEILNLAERFMKDSDEWRFLDFLKIWNPDNFRDEDWKETKKEEQSFKPLALKAIKKAFNVLKSKTNEANLDWIIAPYEKAIELFPEDEWLLREKALIHFKNNELDHAIDIFKKLVLELGDKHYIWQDFANCIVSDNLLKIGMLSKALSLEKNEDFLGEIRLDLAELLIEENLYENAYVELQIYQKHRELKGWRLSGRFIELQHKTNSITLNLIDNRALYIKYISVAENFAYSDFEWAELVLVDKWKDNSGRERFIFTDGKTLEFSISKKRFELLKQLELGKIIKFKIYKQELKKEVDAKYSWMGKTIITEYKYIPLVAEFSNKENWSILHIEYGFIEYINKEKKVLHLISNTGKEIFYKYDNDIYKAGDFVSFRSYSKTIKDENRVVLVQIKNCEKTTALQNFKNRIVVIDDVNNDKKIFHFVLGKGLITGVASYNQTEIRPNIGDFLKIHYAVKKDKLGEKKIVSMCLENTNEKDESLQKNVIGDLVINERGFAFVKDCYVSKDTLKQYKIEDNCYVVAQAVYTGKGDKWKVYKLDKILKQNINPT